MTAHDTWRDERGMALVLALMALLVLTALGLTLAATTVCETQCAVNYRWSRKAFYNAEAGIAVGRAVLAELSWTYALPPTRGPWQQDADSAGRLRAGPLGNFASVAPSRDFEMAACDIRGNGMGYGVVLFDGSTTYQNVSEIYDRQLDGAFTLWVRRPLIYEPDGRTQDYPHDDVLVLVSEGVAPAANPSLSVPQARQVIEVTLYSSHLGVTIGPPPFAFSQAAAAATTTPFKVGSAVCR